jgi:hypothetical protein
LENVVGFEEAHADGCCHSKRSVQWAEKHGTDLPKLLELVSEENNLSDSLAVIHFDVNAHSLSQLRDTIAILDKYNLFKTIVIAEHSDAIGENPVLVETFLQWRQQTNCTLYLNMNRTPGDDENYVLYNSRIAFIVRHVSTRFQSRLLTIVPCGFVPGNLQSFSDYLGECQTRAVHWSFSGKSSEFGVYVVKAHAALLAPHQNYVGSLMALGGDGPSPPLTEEFQSCWVAVK